jgi:hypothetical protein
VSTACPRSLRVPAPFCTNLRGRCKTSEACFVEEQRLDGGPGAIRTHDLCLRSFCQPVSESHQCAARAKSVSGEEHLCSQLNCRTSRSGVAVSLELTQCRIRFLHAVNRLNSPR